MDTRSEPVADPPLAARWANWRWLPVLIVGLVLGLVTVPWTVYWFFVVAWDFGEGVPRAVGSGILGALPMIVGWTLVGRARHRRAGAPHPRGSSTAEAFGWILALPSSCLTAFFVVALLFFAITQ